MASSVGLAAEDCLATQRLVHLPLAHLLTCQLPWRAEQSQAAFLPSPPPQLTCLPASLSLCPPWQHFPTDKGERTQAGAPLQQGASRTTGDPPSPSRTVYSCLNCQQAQQLPLSLRSPEQLAFPGGGRPLAGQLPPQPNGTLASILSPSIFGNALGCRQSITMAGK